MTRPVAHPAHRPTMDDNLIELAILGVLAERREIYPSFLAGELRRRAPLLPAARIRPVLEQLWADRRVARLWHRYMLPVDVPGVRDKWLAMIERRRTELESMEECTNAYEAGRATLDAWDGWTIGTEIA